MSNIETSSIDTIHRSRSHDYSLSDEENFFYNRILELNINEIIPKCHSEGIKYACLTPLSIYYSDDDINNLLESLAKKGKIKKSKYKTILLCPECSSQLMRISLFCSKCGSDNIKKVEIIEHQNCGYYGEKDEFIQGKKIQCPKCSQILINKSNSNSKNDSNRYEVMDFFYKCEKCEAKYGNIKAIFTCENCTNQFNNQEVIYLSPSSYKIKDRLSTKNESKMKKTSVENKKNVSKISDPIKSENILKQINDNQIQLEIKTNTSSNSNEKKVDNLRNVKILIIEESRELASQLLASVYNLGQKYSLNVEHAHNGVNGLKSLRKKFDLIILDMILSDINGTYILKEMKKWKISTPVVILSNSKEDRNYVKSMNMKNVEFLEKNENTPMKVSELLDEILTYFS